MNASKQLEAELARRSIYTAVKKEGQQRPPHVEGMGDVVFKQFQCLNPECTCTITIRADSIGEDYSITCPDCGFEHQSGGETKLFKYKLVTKADEKVIEAGAFVILHDDYLAEAKLHKYCLLCYTLKPVDLFSRHSSRDSGYQGECRLCKTLYNGIKNQSRTTDQHREAAQRRRLYNQLAARTERIDSRAVFDKFKGKCFNCDASLTFDAKGADAFHLDHTLPVRLLWPMRTENATLLCGTCNNEKHDHWPSIFYKEKEKLKSLALLTGYDFDLLAGDPQINTDAVELILQDVDSFLETWIPYPKDIKKVRRLIREQTGEDIFDSATHVPEHLRDPNEIID